MPKAILEFALPDEEWEYQSAAHGADYRIVIREILDELRRHQKYEEHPESVRVVFEEFRTLVHEALDSHGLGPDFE